MKANKKYKLINKLFVLLRIRKNKFFFQGFVYLKSNGEVSKSITNKVRWLEEITIAAFNETKAENEAFHFFNKKYPDYNVFIF